MQHIKRWQKLIERMTLFVKGKAKPAASCIKLTSSSRYLNTDLSGDEEKFRSLRIAKESFGCHRTKSSTARAFDLTAISAFGADWWKHNTE
jgi:hypothetical protein